MEFKLFNGLEVTLCRMGSFGLICDKIKLTGIENIREYAQYTNIPKCNYVPKGKRKVTSYMVAYDPQWVIIDGWDNPEPVESSEFCYEDPAAYMLKNYLAVMVDKNKIIFDSRKEQLGSVRYMQQFAE